MRKICLLLLTIIATFPLSGEDFGNPQVNELYSEVLNAGFWSDKVEAGEKLGEQGSMEAKEALFTLLDSDSYWDREAAAAGLFYFNDREICFTLLDKYFNDFMISSTLEAGFLKHWEIYSPLIKEQYYMESNSESRRMLLNLMGMSGSGNSENFLKTIVYDRNSADREEAFRLLSQYFQSNNDTFLRSFINDKDLKPDVITYIIENGSSKDLPIFLDILETGEEEYYNEALTAVNRWGDSQTREKIYYKYLTSSQDEYVYAAVSIFENVTSERIMLKLCDISKNGAYQSLRILAGLRLTAYSDRRIIPCLIYLTNEEYIAAKSDGWDIFLAHITLGITALFDHFSERRRKKDFYNTRDQIQDKLQQISGENFEDFNDWKDWAIFNGFTIDNQSLVQYLYSSNEEERERAVNAAFSLLGISEEDFLEQNPELDNGKALSIETELARLLLTTGIIEN